MREVHKQSTHIKADILIAVIILYNKSSILINIVMEKVNLEVIDKNLSEIPERSDDSSYKVEDRERTPAGSTIIPYFCNISLIGLKYLIV